MRRTKIVCTIGPATSSPEALRHLIEAGMNVARLNFSHGSHQEHAAVISHLRAISLEMDTPLAILQDLSGPKVRVGNIAGGGVLLKPGARISLTLADVPGDEEQINLPVPEIFEAVSSGTELMLDDGLLELKVISKKADSLLCEVIVGGLLTSHKGVNVPGVTLPIAAVTDKDLDDLRFGIAQKVDYVAASFVRSASDIAVLRGVCEAARAKIPLIAKIEKHEAIDNIDQIMEAVDGIMVARGDLGVEVPIDEVPIIQKMLIRKANRAGKPVITATQMLDSMIRNPRPTRAEVTDVANVIFDGTDALMLSGETAVGAYPFDAVRMMAKIAVHTEASLDYAKILDEKMRWETGQSITGAIGQATCDIAHDLRCAAILTASATGRTARVVSRYRPRAPIIAATNLRETYQRLALIWGVHPLVVDIADDSDSMMQACIDAAERSGIVRDKDVVVLTGGVPVGRPGSTNFIKSTGLDSHCGRSRIIMTQDTHDLPRRRRHSPRWRQPRHILGLWTRVFLLTVFIGFLAVAALGLVAKAIRPYREARLQSAELSESRQQIAALDADNLQIARRIAYLRTPDGVASEARKMGYLHPGEIPIVVEGMDSQNAVSPDIAPVTSAPSHPDSVTQRFWRHLTGH